MYIFHYIHAKKGTGMIQQWEDAAAVTWKLNQETSQIIRQETRTTHKICGNKPNLQIKSRGKAKGGEAHAAFWSLMTEKGDAAAAIDERWLAPLGFVTTSGPVKSIHCSAEELEVKGKKKKKNESSQALGSRVKAHSRNAPHENPLKANSCRCPRCCNYDESLRSLLVPAASH